MNKNYDAIVMFSGGLDSLLCARLLERQGLHVLCLHFVSPFFGSFGKVPVWRDIYQLDIRAIDASEPFVRMFAAYPPRRTGKTLNPCVDCKITMLKLAREHLPECGARFIATGEVLGQRPMSQRADTLNAIARDSGCKDILLRPLSAQLLAPTTMEENGLVDRSKLLRISGRGRLDQLALAQELGISKIPAPGGGCRLTEIEAARRYWPLLRKYWLGQADDIKALVSDFWISNLGRLLFRDASAHMLCVGRNERDNAKLAELKGELDLLIKLPFPGPLGLARMGARWPQDELEEACAVVASYASRAQKMNKVAMRLIPARGDAGDRAFLVRPDRHENLWRLPQWQDAHEEIKKCRQMAENAKNGEQNTESETCTD